MSAAVRDRDIHSLEEGIARSAEEQYRKSLNDDDGGTFFTSANVVVLIQKVYF